MADNKKAPDLNRSSSSSAVIAAPILAGLGVGVHKLYNNPTFKNHFKSGNVLENKIKAVEKFGASLGIGAEVDYLAQIRTLKNGPTPANSDLIQTAWRAALMKSVGSKTLLEPFDPTQPFKAIEFFAANNKSFTGQKVLSSFMHAVSALGGHEELTGIALNGFTFKAMAPHTFFKKRIRDLSQFGSLSSVLTDIESGIRKGDSRAVVEWMLHSREGFAGKQLMMHVSGGRFGRKGSALEIPFELANQQGVILHGATQQTKRITGRYGFVNPETHMITSTVSHDMMVATMFRDRILPQLGRSNMTSAESNRLIRGFNQEMIEGSQFIHNLPPGLSPATDSAVALGSQRLRLMYDPLSGLKDLSLGAGGLAKTLKSNHGFFNIYPGTSPDQLAKGIVSTLDAQSMWLGGSFFPWERRPLQALGRDVGPTSAAQAARLANPLRGEFSWLHTSAFQQHFGNTPIDLLARTTYVSEKTYSHLAQKALGGVAGGAGLMSRNLSSQAMYQTGLQVNVSMNAGVYNKIQQALGFSTTGQYKFDHVPDFKEGEILGFDSLGNEITYKNGMKFHGAYEYTDMHERFLRLEGTHELTSEQYAKYFGGAKAVMQQTGQADIARLVRENTPVMGLEGNEVLLGMDTLKKNRALHNLQMLTALQEFTKIQMSAASKTFDVLEFGKTASNIIQHAETIGNPDEVIRGVFMQARQHKLDSYAMGRVFGALPDVHGSSWQESMTGMGLHFNPSEISAINQGVAHGVSSLFYGGASTAGGRGSVEPRFFEQLGGPQYGKLGGAISKDISLRQLLANPEVVREQNILSGALSSLVHGAPNMKVDNYHVKDLLSGQTMSTLFTKGGIVNMGSSVEGLSSIYVPGQEESASMREYITTRGTRVYNKLQNAYEDFLESAAHVENRTGQVTRAAAVGKMHSLVAELGEASVRTISGKGYGLARREVMGSKYLRIVSGTEAALGDLRTVGVNKLDVKHMFRDLYEVHAGDKATLEGLKAQHASILSGGTIGGVLARDPDIGPFSIGPTRMKIVGGLAPGNVMVPQRTASVVDALGNTHQVGLGHMGGRAGDYDGDNAHLMLVSSNIEKDVHGHYSLNNPLVRLDEEYSIRQQLLKAKAGSSGGITALEEEIAAAEKLALSKTRVGPISTPLSTMRAALVNSTSTGAITPERYLNASSLLEALENIPILGKHVAADKISTLGEQLDRIASAASKNNPSEMHNITKEIFSNSSDAGTALAGRLLEQGEHVSVNGEKRFIPGINLQQATSDLSESLGSFRAASSGFNEDLMRSITLGRRNLKFGEIPEFLSHQGGLLNEFKIAGKSGLGAQLSRTAQAVGNKLTAIGADVIKHAGKPLMWGLGGALGLSALLSRPITNLQPGDSSPPISIGRIDSGAGTQPTPESLHPDSQVSGEPSASTRMPAPSARVAPEQMSARVRVRGTSRGRTNMGALSGDISRRMPGSTTVNMNVRDRRASLTQQHIDNIRRR